MKYCSDCGNDEFVSTQAEVIEYLRKKQQELEESRKKAQEEAERIAEEQRKAEEEAAKKAQEELNARMREEQKKAVTSYIVCGAVCLVAAVGTCMLLRMRRR